MVHKSVGISRYGDQTPTRTPDDRVWKDVKARNLVSGVRFSWDRYQKMLFVEFLKTVGLNFKNADITPLLHQLNLDGYENICNECGDNVHELIEEKVRRKLKNTADEMDEEELMEASFRPSINIPKATEIIAPNPRHANHEQQLASAGNRENASKDLALHPALFRETSLPPHKIISENAKPAQKNPPLLKMPKPKATTPSSTPETIVKREPADLQTPIKREPLPTPPPSHPKTTSNNPRIFTAGRSTSTANPSLEWDIPAFEFKGPQTPRRSPTPVAGSYRPDGANWRKQKRAQQSIQRLVSYLPKVDNAIKEVKAAFDDLQATRENKELVQIIEMINHMSVAYADVELDAEGVDEFATNLAEK